MAAVKCEDVKNELTILAKYEREEAKLQAMLQSLRKQISDKKNRIAQLFDAKKLKKRTHDMTWPSDGRIALKSSRIQLCTEMYADVIDRYEKFCVQTTEQIATIGKYEEVLLRQLMKEHQVFKCGHDANNE